MDNNNAGFVFFVLQALGMSVWLFHLWLKSRKNISVAKVRRRAERNASKYRLLKALS
jgi:hypothetical protein